MKGAQHICSICHQEFSRNSNAKRHNINIHASQAQIVPLRVFRPGDTSDWLKFKKSGFFHSSKGQSREERLSATLETIGREFESCEHELQMLSSQERAMFLAQLVVHSLTCEDPRDPMKKFQKD